MLVDAGGGGKEHRDLTSIRGPETSVPIDVKAAQTSSIDPDALQFDFA